jgi:hypothetical protein
MARRLLVAKTKFCENLPPFPEKKHWVAFAIEYANELIKRNFKVEFDDELVINDPIGEFLQTVSFPFPVFGFYELFADFYKKNKKGSYIPSLREFNFDLEKRGYIRKSQRIDSEVLKCWCN